MSLPRIVSVARDLGREADQLAFAPPVAYVYNPLVYARKTHEQFLRRYANHGVEALLIGMNPGPWGMTQTGVPFGEIALVRDWLGIEDVVGRPEREHPKRQVVGFLCSRSEVSGRRLWGWARDRFDTPERFFVRFFVWNYCPLVFLEESGRNRTPDKLKASERAALYAICDRALARAVETLSPGRVIGIGGFATGRAKAALDDSLRIDTILHPSPASPLANRGWAEQVEEQLAAMGIALH